MIFESHAHYDDEAFNEDRDILLSSMRDNGVEYIINVSADFESIDSIYELTKKYDFVYGTVGVHPGAAQNMTHERFEYLKKAALREKMVAIGEIGLDYYWDKENHEKQIYWFERQMDLAREKKLPIVVHSRDAAADTLDVIKANKAEEIGGIIHCFSYGKELAREYLNMGFYLGIGGVVTFNNGKKLKEVVEYAPIEQLVLETDSPYLSPVPFRGKRNSSRNLSYVAEAIGQIKGITTEEVLAITNENAKKVYKLI